MRNIKIKPYLFFIFSLFLLVSIPRGISAKWRSGCVGTLAPIWSKAVGKSSTESEVEILKRELALEKEQMASVKDWLLFEERIDEQLQRLKTLLQHQNEDDLYWKSFYERRSEELSLLIDLQLQALPARVIFREPTSWGSTLWLNVGEKNNEALGKSVVAKNSPVLFGDSVIGVVEIVESDRCRVRLITDSSLTPSVRAIRGESADAHLVTHVDALLRSLNVRSDIFANEAEEKEFLQKLSQLKNKLLRSYPDRFLAKGQLFGSSEPYWRSRRPLLHGIGFNAEFADKEGPARALRSDEPLVQVGDILMTTGLDGVFPAGLKIALVTKVHCLKEGSCAYDLDAMPTAGNLNDLTNLIVLPPLIRYN